MKKICKSIAFTLILLCISIMPIFAFDSGMNKNGKNADAVTDSVGAYNSFVSSNVPKIYLEAEKTDKNGVAQIGESRYKVGFYIKATAHVSNVKVSWRTRDMTAIASQGDYNKKDTSYTLNGTSSSLLYVVVYRNGVATRVDRKLSRFQDDNDLTSDDAITRNFFIEITDISCDESVATIDKTRKQLVATTGSEYTFSVTKIVDSTDSSKYMSYFSSYDWPNTFSNHPWGKYYVPRNERRRDVIDIDKSPNVRDGHKDYSDAAYPSMGIFNEFINRGYADLYATIRADTYEDKLIGGSDNVRVSIVYAKRNENDEKEEREYICQYDIEYGGWSSEHTYDMLQMQTSSRYVTSPGKVLLGDNLTRHYYNGDHYYYYRIEYWEVKDPNRRIQVEFWDYEDYEDRYFYDVSVDTIIADTKAPEVSEYYLQQEPIKEGEKLGLSVRFTEPVQLIGNKKPIISARINNNARYNIDFEYVAGSGTDTLYFEWDPSASMINLNMDITSFTLCDFLNASSVADYSFSMNKVQNPQIFESDDTDSFKGDSSKYTYYDPVYPTLTDDFMKHNKLSKPTLSKTIIYKLDLRTPEISTKINPDDMKSNKYLEVPIVISGLNKEGKLYYTWSESNFDPDVYDNVVTNLDDVYTIRASGKNGKFYLYVKAVSAYGKFAKLKIGQFKFDDKAPSIDLSVIGDLTARTFNIIVSDGAEGTDYASGVTQVTLTLAKDAECNNIVQTYSYNAEENREYKKSVTITAESLGIKENEYDTYYAFVTAYDALGNKTQTDVTKYKFDRRSFIDANFEYVYFDSKNRVLQPSGEDFKIIDMSNLKSYESLTLVFTTSDTTGAEVGWIVKNAKGETFKCGGSPSKINQQISISSELPSGYYTIAITATESDTVKYSPEMVFYFTRNMQEEGLNYYTKLNKGILLTNSVYQIDKDLPYYYMDKNGNIQIEKYGNSAKPATFSSKYEAIEYLKYMEYQDLYPVKIDSTQADLLNGKSSPNFLKAADETMLARANQIWIRYKTTSFDKDPTTSQWAYYYYQGNDLTIKQEYLSQNLVTSISTICERLAKNYVDNVILVGEGNVNKYNEPYLENDQIHYNYESVSETKCNIAFDSTLYYNGDTGIYNSTIVESNKKYNIATNLDIAPSDYNRLFFKSKSNNTYTEIDLTRYNNLSQVITASGIYDFVELDVEGARKYSVYIDKDAPILTAYIQDPKGNIITQEFNKSSQGVTYTTKSFSFGSFTNIEKDEFAYVSVWRYLTNKTGELLYVYLRNDLDNNSYVLDNGDYHIEVYDRSGNGYSFIVRVSSQDFICETVEKENENITVTCNREENEISAYEIYLNGELLTSKYSKKNKFELSGVYTIYIRDIFNNEYDYEIDFQRTYPTVSWQYYDKSLDEYIYCSDTSKKMKITRIDETTYKIVTSTLLQFRYDSLYKYQFVGNVDYNENGISHIVKINSLQGFTLKVNYAQYTEATVTYICEVDDSAPNISVKNEIEIYNVDEIEYFNQQLKNGNVGDVLKYNTISYSKRNVVNSYLTNGDTVKSRNLRISAVDNYGVAAIEVYLNESLLYTETKDFSNIAVSRYGDYKIVAYDIYDNKSEFIFTNKITKNIAYYVDDTEKTCDQSTLQYFDIQGNFTKIDYGKQSIELLLKTDCLLSFKIADNTVAYSTLEIIDGKIYFITYKIAKDRNTKVIYAEHSAPIFDIADSKYQVDDWYEITDKNLTGKVILAKYDSENNIHLSVKNDSTLVCTVEGRIKINDVEPFYFRAELSKSKSDVVVKDRNNNNIVTNQDGNQIKINTDFCVSLTNLSDKIKFIKVYYSVNGNFDKVTWSYDGTPVDQHFFSDNGLYLIEIQNVYDNVTKYYILKFVDFMTTVSTEFVDGEKFDYSTDYQGNIYSNNAIYINAYSEYADFKVSIKDGQNFKDYAGAIKTIQNGVTVVKLWENGEYSIIVTDEFGNKKYITAEINSYFLPTDENIIYGYNEKALRKDEGYTNNQLSIDKTKINNDICYISIKYNDKNTILLDRISENKQELFENKLNFCIGSDGDGQYIVVFRDKYGNKILEKVIHYRNQNNTTLQLSRTIRSSAEEMNCDIADAIENGFWANNKLIIKTSSSEYILKVDGEEVGCPWELNFDSGAEEGNLVRQISYTDEYGNEYNFEAHLYRQKLELSIPSTVKTTNVDGTLTTRNNISLTVPYNAVCTYLFDGVEYPYESNKVLKQDGKYRFTVKDLAGNISSLTLKKDTVVEYEMIETETDSKVINGGIICSKTVWFKALNGDSSYIKYVFKDGKLIEDYDDNKFAGSGKWEIILADNIGNESYYQFQIITHPLKEFVYTVPYGYKVTEIWHVEGDDAPESYMQYIQGEGTIIKLKDNGKYTVKMSSDSTGLSSSFTITVNNAKPQIKLVGCNENETTLNDISISGYKVGDKIEIYKDKKLYKTIEILTSQTDAPTITEGGYYTIVVTNEAGVQTSVSFVKKHVPNAPGNILIIVLIVIAAVVVFIGLVYRQRSKVDE